MKQTICVDFDGVIVEARYKPEHEGPFAPPIPGAIDSLNALCAVYDVVILTSRPERDHKMILNWLRDENGVPVAGVTSEKVPAIAYIDDRAIEFDGSWPDTLYHLKYGLGA